MTKAIRIPPFVCLTSEGANSLLAKYDVGKPGGKPLMVADRALSFDLDLKVELAAGVFLIGTLRNNGGAVLWQLELPQ